MSPKDKFYYYCSFIPEICTNILIVLGTGLLGALMVWGFVFCGYQIMQLLH